MSDHRAKTTPGSTTGSFAPATGARSRVEPVERVCACGQPITSKDPTTEVCMHCYYEGKPLTAAFASQITRLSAATGREWHVEHTGGGCFWIATRTGDAYIAITSNSGELGGADTPADIADGDGYMIGMYTDEDDEGTYLYPSDDDDLVAAAAAACSTVFSTSSDSGSTVQPAERVCGCGQPITATNPALTVCMKCLQSNPITVLPTIAGVDGDRRCVSCSEWFHDEDGITFDARTGGPLCSRCDRS